MHNWSQIFPMDLRVLNGRDRFSQIPDFGHLWWLSYLATLMSFAYVSFLSNLSGLHFR